MRKRSILNFLPAILFLFLHCTSATKGVVDSAELVINNAKIYTVNKDQPEAEALAIKDGKIVFIGNNKDVKNYIGEKKVGDKIRLTVFGSTSFAKSKSRSAAARVPRIKSPRSKIRPTSRKRFIKITSAPI